MRLKKYLSILLSVLMVLVCAGCNKADEVPERGPFGPDNYKTIEPPADGWTLETLNEVLYVNGYEVDIPFTLEDIHWDKEPVDIIYYESDNTCVAVLEYDKNDDVILLVQAKANSKKTFDQRSKIFKVWNETSDDSSYPNDEKFITVNGLSVGSSSDDIEKSFGITEFQDESFFDYYFTESDRRCAVSFDCSDSKLCSIQISI
jgi:hypothetical protein